jgi:NAD(P)-dependent dehydrogenase (short-subunit alcohol dehydrogenase family)
MSVESERSIIGLEGKVALVTGGGAGIGRAAAELLGRAGMSVAVAEIVAERAAAVRQTLDAAGVENIVVEADVRKGADVRRVVEAVDGAFGRLDVLVNNVGDFLGFKNEFADSDESQWQALYEVNLLHIFQMSKAAIPLMKRSGEGGSIVNVSTIEAFRGIPLTVVYAAFKAGVTGFTQSLAVELGQHGIRVNAVAPETTNTAQITATSRVPPENREALKRWFPIGRFGEGSDSAGAILYLASPLLSGWVSGSTIVVDGGALAAGAWMRMENDNWTHLPIIAADGYTRRTTEGGAS